MLAVLTKKGRCDVPGRRELRPASAAPCRIFAGRAGRGAIGCSICPTRSLPHTAAAAPPLRGEPSKLTLPPPRV